MTDGMLPERNDFSSRPPAWSREIDIGEEVAAGQVAVRVGERFFTVGTTLKDILQDLKGSDLRAEAGATVTRLSVRLSVSQAQQLAAQLLSYLARESGQRRLWRQIQRGFVKIPLVYPTQGWTDRWRGRVLTPFTVAGSVLLLVLSMVVIVSRINTLPVAMGQTLPWTSYLTLWSLFTLTTVVHELGHALVAAHFGIRTRSMGIAIFVLQPAGYADVSNGWLSSSRARLYTALGGFMAQVVPLFIFSLAWAATHQSIFGYYCVTNLGFFAINLIPLLRTDGYWVLVNLLNEPALMQSCLQELHGAVRDPLQFAQRPGRRQLYAVLGLASLMYTVGTYLLGAGYLLSYLPARVQLLAPLVPVTGLLYFAVRWGIRAARSRQRQRPNALGEAV